MFKSKTLGCLLAVVGGVLLIGGIACYLIGGIRFFQSMMKMGDNLQQITAPGTSRLTIAEPGTKVIYHEYRSVINGRHYSNPQGLGHMQCRVIGPDGEELSLEANGMNETYNVGGRSGVAVWQFEAPVAGAYEVQTSRLTDGQANEVVLAIGPSLMEGFFPHMGLFFVLLGAGSLMFFLGPILMVVGIVIRLVRGKAAKERAGGQPA